MNYIKHDGRHLVDGENIAFTRFSSASGTGLRIVSLHGGGQAVRQRVFYLGEMLASAGHDFLCFDFSGHGESTGLMPESSLERRRMQAIGMIGHVFAGSADVIIGNSMGAYIAADICCEMGPIRVVLMCPALYAAEAHATPFTQDFTDILRSPGSYRSNQVKEKLDAFNGDVHLIMGELDMVIPEEVIEIYATIKSEGRVLTITRLPGLGHMLHAHAANDPKIARLFYQIITEK